jgi:adenylylsulfate kinase
MISRIGTVVWITGLSGAGKSTLANATTEKLRAAGEPVVQLDGDALREVFGAAATIAENHTREARLALAMQYTQLCRVIAEQGQTVVIATISMFKEVHAWNRRHLPGYLEVYLKTPIAELRRRDPKGIYRRFDAGQLSHVAGLDLPVDEPEGAELLFEFAPGQEPAALADRIIASITTRRNDWAMTT